MLHRLLLGECCLCLRKLSLENADLLLGDPDTRRITQRRSLLLADIRLRLLRALHRTVAGLRQSGVTAQFLLRKNQGSLIRLHRLVRLLDRQFLLVDLLGESIDTGLRRCDVCARLIERGLIVVRVDPGEHLARLDRLVVVDRPLGDVARHLRADQDRMRRHVSVIGRHEETPDCPVIVGIKR